METRKLCRTGLDVSILGLGCGAVGGLMVRGSPADRERVVARALDCGITYFDTAPQYGDGQSEQNLGVVLKKLRPDIVLGTKIRLTEADKADIDGAVARGMAASLERLGRDHVDLYQFHNAITAEGSGDSFTPAMMREAVIPAFEKLRAAGKTRFFGITAIGDTAALHELIGSGALDTAQIAHNLLNATMGEPAPAGFVGQDYGNLLATMEQVGTGAIGIRAMAAGALSGAGSRHPIASAPPATIGSGADYAADEARAAPLRALVDEGYVATMAEAAMRFAVFNPRIATTLIGIASVDEFEAAVAAVGKGRLPQAALERAAALLR